MRRQPPTDSRPVLQPPQFRLRTLFWLVGMLCIFFALANFLGGYALFALVILVLSIAAHMTGTALGNQLRSHGSTRELDEAAQRQTVRMRFAPPRMTEYAPTTRLGQRYSLGKPILVLTALGIIAGGIGGWGLVIRLYEQAAWPNLSAAALAGAVLGGIGSFVGVGFCQVLLGAIWQATRDARRR